jgi:hypothetical protein
MAIMAQANTNASGHDMRIRGIPLKNTAPRIRWIRRAAVPPRTIRKKLNVILIQTRAHFKRIISDFTARFSCKMQRNVDSKASRPVFLVHSCDIGRFRPDHPFLCLAVSWTKIVQPAPVQPIFALGANQWIAVRH